MKGLSDIQKICAKRFDSKLAEYLCNPEAAELELNLQPPTESAALKDLDGVKAWIANLTKAEKSQPLTILWETKLWKKTGAQELPTKAKVTGLDAIAALSHNADRLKLLQAALNDLLELCPKSPEALPQAAQLTAKYQAKLVELDTADWQRALQMSAWLLEHDDWHIYSRTIPVAGIDTKYLEKHAKLVESICQLSQELAGLEVKAFDFKKNPDAFSIRFLDPDLAPRLYSGAPIEYCQLSLSDLQALYTEKTVPKVIICENQQSFLALPSLSNTIALWGAGYKVLSLQNLAWLNNTQVIYWGDIDSHGFSILAKFRSMYPYARITSMLMDKDTFDSYSDLAVIEPNSDYSDTEEYLVPEEKICLSYIRSFSESKRLEQERIPWDQVLAKLSELGFS